LLQILDLYGPQFPDVLDFALELDAHRVELARGDPEVHKISRLELVRVFALFAVSKERALACPNSLA
jgi:hypothetical protein